MTPEQRQNFITHLTDEQAGALTVYGEARNQSVAGLQGVLSVIRNRVGLKKWGETWAAVVLAPKQFSCWNDNDPNANDLVWMATDLILGKPLPLNPAFDVCLFMAERMTACAYPDNTNKSTHYFAPKGVVHTPNWASAPAIRQTVIGGHAFYSGVK